MDEVDISCPACNNPLYRRALSIVTNVRRRNIDDKRAQFICQQCMRTYTQEELDEPDLKGETVTEGW